VAAAFAHPPPPPCLILEFAPPDDVPALTSGALALSSVHDGFGGIVLRAREGTRVEMVRRRHYRDATGAAKRDAAFASSEEVELLSREDLYPAALPLPTNVPGAELVAEYEGDSDAGVRHGVGAMRWFDPEYSGIDALSYAGAWRADVPHGEGTIVWSDGREYAGLLADARPQGAGRCVWPRSATDATPRAETLADGTARIDVANWSLTYYEGDWALGAPEGESGVGLYSNGVRFEGAWKNGRPHGAGVLTSIFLASAAGSATLRAASAALGAGGVAASDAAGGILLTLHATGDWVDGALSGTLCAWQLFAGVPSVDALSARSAADAPLRATFARARSSAILSESLALDDGHLASARVPRAVALSDAFAPATPRAAPGALSAREPASHATLARPSGRAAETSARSFSPSVPAFHVKLAEAAARFAAASGAGDAVGATAAAAATLTRLPVGAALVESYTGGYAAGMRDAARATLALADGSIFEGSFRSGRANGFGTLRASDNAVFSGKFVGGVPKGLGSRVGPDGVTVRGVWDGSTLLSVKE
jgi:hypothetical protein